MQGVPLQRTADLDITPSGDAENKKRLVRALQDLDAKLRVPGLQEGVEIPLDERTFTEMLTMTFLTGFGPFDISFVPDGTSGYEKRASGREKDAGHLLILIEFLRESGEET